MTYLSKNHHLFTSNRGLVERDSDTKFGAGPTADVLDATFLEVSRMRHGIIDATDTMDIKLGVECPKAPTIPMILIQYDKAKLRVNAVGST